MLTQPTALLLAIALSMACTPRQESAYPTQTFKKTLKGTPPLTYDFTRTLTHRITPVKQAQTELRSTYFYCLNDSALVGYNLRLQNILCYGQQFNLVTFGQRGPGPNEIESGYYFRLQSDSVYWIFDLAKQRLGKFTYTNQLLDYQKFNTAHIPLVDYMGMSPRENSFLIFHTTDTGSYALSIFDFSGKRIVKTWDINAIIPQIGEKYDYEMVIEGEFHKSDSFAVYHFYKAGYFLVIDSKHEKPEIYPTIDKTKFPVSIKTPQGDGSYSISTNPPYILFESATVSNKYLYILSSLQSHNKKAIDIYDLPTGTYVGSVNVPNLADGQRPEIIAVSPGDDYLFIQFEDLVLGKFRLRKINTAPSPPM